MLLGEEEEKEVELKVSMRIKSIRMIIRGINGNSRA